jgi:predicted HTH transcriptional regulator
VVAAHDGAEGRFQLFIRRGIRWVAVVLLEIHPARTAPVAFQNIRYIRIDSHKTKLGEHSDKEARLWEVLGQKADWSGELVAGASLDDLGAGSD